MKFSHILKASKTKHPISLRSAFLSEFMRVFGSDSGAPVIAAFKDGDVVRFREAMDGVTDSLVAGINHNAKKNEPSHVVKKPAFKVTNIQLNTGLSRGEALKLAPWKASYGDCRGFSYDSKSGIASWI